MDQIEAFQRGQIEGLLVVLVQIGVFREGQIEATQMVKLMNPSIHLWELEDRIEE